VMQAVPVWLVPRLPTLNVQNKRITAPFHTLPHVTYCKCMA
jgi:hypothetical protein